VRRAEITGSKLTLSMMLANNRVPSMQFPSRIEITASGIRMN